jgi:hypothetical protein
VFQYSISTPTTGIPDLSDMYRMIRYFDDVGRPAGLVYNEGSFSVWRNGVGQFAGQKINDDPVGVLLIHVAGFEKVWRKAGGRVGKQIIPPVVEQ